MIYKFHSELVCDDCSGTFTFRMGRMRSYFIAFFIDQDVPPDPKIVYQNPFAYDKALLFLLSQVPNYVLICTAKKKRSDIIISKKSVKTNFIIFKRVSIFTAFTLKK